MNSSVDIKSLILEEDWELIEVDGATKIKAYGRLFDVRHPAVIYLRLYRDETDPEIKYQHMKKVHDYLWPKDIATWHYWTVARFKAHCKGYNYISMAGGASCAKSLDCAKIAVIFWLSDPQSNGVIVSSTTLESLGARIWGYAMDLLSRMAVKMPFQYLGGNTPKILYPTKRSESEIRDTIHGLFAVAMKSGDAEKSISSLIGRHPRKGLMLIIDESTDVSANVIGAFANLDSSGKMFQVYAIGNSNSVDDLHGAMSTPKIGWDKLNPLETTEWETTRKNGICLFFSCYESPAIHESDPIKKAKLSKFLITQETIDSKKRELGENSDAFYRFVLGFWKMQSTEDRVLSTQFLTGFGAGTKTEWSGVYPLSIVGGLDTAFSTGGDQCILRLGILGYDINGLLVLDFMGDKMNFVIPILRNDPDDASIQIGKKVIKLLDDNRCSLDNVALDATGQGRAMGGVLQLLDKNGKVPLSIYSTQAGIKNKDAVGVIIKSSYDLWYTLREFISHEQIRGLDNETMVQLTSRQVIKNKSGTIALESKRDYKIRMGAKNPIMAHSPDKADAAALTLQAAIMRFGFSLGQRKTMPKVEGFDHLKLLTHRQEEFEKKQEQKKFVLKANFTSNLEGLKRKRF